MAARVPIIYAKYEAYRPNKTNLTAISNKISRGLIFYVAGIATLELVTITIQQKPHSGFELINGVNNGIQNTSNRRRRTY